MKIAITGSTGLIGEALIEGIERRGDTAIRIVRSTPGPTDVLWNIDEGTIESDKLEGVDAVVHLAGAGIGDKRWTPERKKVILESRVQGTNLLAKTLANLENRPSTLLIGSAIGIYGDKGDEELTEENEPGSGFLAQVVVQWEAAAQPAIEAGIRTVFARSGIVLSLDGGALKEQLLPFKLGIGGRFGDGSHYWSWISIDDQVNAMLYLIDNDQISGPVNVTSPNPVTNAEYTKSLGGALGRPTFLPTPRFAVNIRLGSELAEEFLYKSTRGVPKVLSDSGFTFAHPTIDSAFEALL